MSVGAEVLNADGQTGMMKLIIAPPPFPPPSNFVNMPKNSYVALK